MNGMSNNNLQDVLENPLKILEREDVVFALKKHWKANHENLRDPEKFVEDFFAYLSQVRNEDDLDIRKISKTYNKKLKECRKECADLGRPKDMFLEIIDRQLAEVETILDFGCGKLAFLKELAENNRNIKNMIGVDPKSCPALEELDGRIKFQRDMKGIANESVDLAVIKLVLHHLEDDAQIKDIFEGIKKVLRPGGKLVVFEESFPESHYESGNVRDYLRQFGLEASDSTEYFLRLSQEDRINFLFLNDWLMNVQNSYMPWTGFYKSMEEWRGLADAVGFKEVESHFLGAIKRRKRKQGMTAYMVWKK